LAFTNFAIAALSALVKVGTWFDREPFRSGAVDEGCGTIGKRPGLPLSAARRFAACAKVAAPERKITRLKRTIRFIMLLRPSLYYGTAFPLTSSAYFTPSGFPVEFTAHCHVPPTQVYVEVTEL
jgi:hypothetical protein